MIEAYRVAGYVKLAKLWERSREQAIAYHNHYFREKYRDNPAMKLCAVYIDITGQKCIKKRPEMLRLIRDCMNGRINCIATQTSAYLAADNEEFFYLIYLLFHLNPPIHIVTEDDHFHIDTINNEEQQTEALRRAASDYIRMNPEGYSKWEKEVLTSKYSEQKR